MRILLIYPDLDINVNYPVGLGLISACLQDGGHETKVIHLNQELGFSMDLPRIRNMVSEFAPHLIAFSITSGQFKYMKGLASFLKQHFEIPILCGGIHPTIDPEEVLLKGGVDLICRGEGEEAVVELANCLEHGEDYRHIRNLGFLDGGKVVMNPLRPLRCDLNSLPYPDRKGFEFDRIVSLKNNWANVMTGRGCLYRCSYCVNNFFFKFHSEMKIQKKVLRQRSVENVLGEIDSLLTDFDNINMINFDDDIFILDKEWVTEFCKKYREAFKTPFACNLRATHVDKDVAKQLFDAGCREVKIGLECGNKEIRKEMLRRDMSDDQIIQAFKIAEEAGLRTWSFNMIGIPTETWGNLMETVRLNAKVRPYILRCSIFYPYKGTALYHYCEENKLLDANREEAYSSHMEGSVLKLKDLSEGRIIKAKKMFKWLVDSESDIEVADFYKALVKYFDQLPDEYWLTEESHQGMLQLDDVIDQLFKKLRKEHYSSRKHLDLNFTEKWGFELP